ncbi:MAG: amylo-alpha-1,6-glucosidase, partial [Bdellovibrionales bacterium]
SASAVFLVLQALLGIYPYAPLKVLFVDPQLPDWLPKIELNGLRVGDSVLHLQFFRREDGRSDYRLMDQIGDVHVVRQPNPWSLTATWSERLRDGVQTLLR